MTENDQFAIRDIQCKRGSTARGFLKIGETLTGPIEIPLVIVHGKTDGPVLCLTAGVHATEYAPIEAMFRLLHSFDPAELSGTVIAVPIVNMHMFAARNGFVSPIDGINLNKIAPGGDGSATEIVAKTLLDEVVTRARYHVDLHGGDFGEMLWAYGGYSLTGNAAQDEQGEALARLLTPGMICLSPQGSLLPPVPGFLTYAATRRGVISILSESGGNGTLEEADVQVHVKGVRNIMRYLGMIEGTPVIHGPQVKAKDRAVTRAKQAGLLRLKVATGDVVPDNGVVAEICNVFGDTVETVRVLHGGTAGLVWAHKAVNTGDPIVRCWTTEPAPPFALTDKFTH
jgi:predicted deacylase